MNDKAMDKNVEASPHRLIPVIGTIGENEKPSPVPTKAEQAPMSKDAMREAVQALFQPWPKDAMGPSDEPESAHRLGYNTAIEDVLNALAAQADADAVKPDCIWQPIETAPKTGSTLLLGYSNSLGNWRTVIGQWMSDEYIGEYWEDPDDAEADWYETAENAEDIPNCWRVTPTHWMPLPCTPHTDAPAAPAQSEAKAVEFKHPDFATWWDTQEVIDADEPCARGLARRIFNDARAIAPTATPAPVKPAESGEARPVSLENLKSTLLTPRAIVRDEDGYLTHPAVPVLDEGVDTDMFFAAFGLESSLVMMEFDGSEDVCNHYFDAGNPGCTGWEPTRPQGDGWLLLEIGDSENGPWAWFIREKPIESAPPAPIGPGDAARLDFMLEKQCWVQLDSLGKYYVLSQDENENYHVLHAEHLTFNTQREAIDAALLAKRGAA